MVKIVIEINSVRHALVEDKVRWFDCDLCSLSEMCRQKEVLLCNMFNRPNHHFEIQRG